MWTHAEMNQTVISTKKWDTSQQIRKSYWCNLVGILGSGSSEVCSYQKKHDPGHLQKV